MHNYERVLLPLLDNLLGKQGLAHEMTTSQRMYRVNYYWVIYINMLDTLIIDSLGGDVNKYFEVPPSKKNLIGKVARTRWVSAERTSKKLMDALNVPASQALIDKVSICNPFLSTSLRQQSPITSIIVNVNKCSCFLPPKILVGKKSKIKKRKCRCNHIFDRNSDRYSFFDFSSQIKV